MIGLGTLGTLAGLLPLSVALHHLLDRDTRARWRSTLFWLALAATLMAGPLLPDLVNGLLVLLMVGLATAGLKPAPIRISDQAQREASAGRLRGRLFLPALCMPVLTLSGAFLLPGARILGHPLVAHGQATLCALTLAIGVALLLAMRLTRAAPSAAWTEARRLSDQVGWSMVLPQMLAALGGIFAVAGVGTVLGHSLGTLAPTGSTLAASALFCVGMALFTAAVGNAFTAFPILMGGIGVPILLHRLGGDPAPVAAIGMLSGFCGTLLTPMAANFNIVPVALLGLADRNAVIRVQAPTALVLLAFNIVLMTWVAFPGAVR